MTSRNLAELPGLLESLKQHRALQSVECAACPRSDLINSKISIHTTTLCELNTFACLSKSTRFLSMILATEPANLKRILNS